MLDKSCVFDVICWHTFGQTSLLDVRPAVTAVPIDQHEPVALRHAPFSVGACLVVIHGYHILQLLCSSFGGHRGTASFSGGCWVGAARQ